MEAGKIAYGIIGLVVAVIIIASLAIPAVTEVSKVPQIEENDYAGPTFDLSDNFSISYNNTAATYTVGGTTIAKPEVKIPIVGADLFTVQLNSSGYNVLRYWDATDTMVSVDLTGDWSLTMASGTITLTFGENTYTRDVELPAIHLSQDGSYLFRDKDADYTEWNTNLDSTFIAYVIVQSNYGFGVGTVAESTVNYGGSIYDVTTTTESNGDGSVTVSNAKMGVGQPLERNVSYFVPIDYTILVDGEGTEAMLFSIVPLLLIVSTLMIAVRMLGGKS